MSANKIDAVNAKAVRLLAGLLLGLVWAATAAPQNPDTDWFRDSKYGVFMHFLPADANGLALVERFDVESLANQLERAGARYFVLTLGQNSGYFNAPNAAYDRFTGYGAGERCAKRDLPLALYEALHAKAIKLMLYLPCQVPNQDARAQKAFGLPAGNRDQPLNLEFAAKWAQVIQEWADRYGDKVAGWWFDGGYEHIHFNEAIARAYAQAARHGNAKAIVTFNPGVKVIHYTQAEDYTAGELNEPFDYVPTSRWFEGSQWHALTFLGSSWGRRNTRYSGEQWAAWVSAVAAKGGVVTLDAGPNYDPQAGPIGSIAPEQLKQLEAIKTTLARFLKELNDRYNIQLKQLEAIKTTLAETGSAASPWDVKALTAAPKWTVLERPKSDGLKAITFQGLPFRGKPTRVFAWLGVPKVKPGEKAPAMVLVHGGGGTAFDEWVRLWVDRGYAAIAMDTCGQVPVGNYGKWFRDDQGGPPGWGGFDQLAWSREDQWTCHAVADAILAHSLIRSLPEVDPERTGVTGISWGGYLTCIVAGVDRRFKLAVPVYGCGFCRDTVFEGELEKLRPEDADRWLGWWDPSVYLGSADLPILWVTGSNDFAYTLKALQRSYRLPKGPRWLCIRLRMPHAHGGPGENPKEIRVFADSILKGGAPLPVITGCGQEGTNVWADYSAKVPVVKAELNFTRDIGHWQDRKWESIPARQTEGRVAAGLPEGTRVYYFNLVDERDCVVSTGHVECGVP
jgi:dienelactone hydrolase